MRKVCVGIVLAASVAAVLGSTFVHAQQPAPDVPERVRQGRYQPSADDLSAFTDARVAAIKAGLRLTPEQEKNWPAFEVAFRNLAKLRVERILASREPPSPPADILERLQRRAESVGKSAAALRQAAEATEPLFKSLDEAQKQRFALLAPMLGTPSFGRGTRSHRHSPDFRRHRRGLPHHGQRSGMDRTSGGIMERINFETHAVSRDDSGNPGSRAAREAGWQ